MSLLVPETGLLFWMLLAFGVVFFVLARYGWPAITGMVEKRSNFINESVRKAEEAELRNETLRKTSDEIIAAAHRQEMEILRGAEEQKARKIAEAKAEATAEAEKIIAAAHQAVEKEKAEAMRDVRDQIAALSLDLTSRLLRRDLAENPGEQQRIVSALLDEMKS